MNSHGYPAPAMPTAHKSPMPIRSANTTSRVPKRTQANKTVAVRRGKRMRKKMFSSSEDEASDLSDGDY